MPKYRIVFHPEAVEELREAERYIEERRKHWGGRFRSEVAAALQFVRSRSDGKVQRHGTYWSVKVSRFPYRLYYRIEGVEIWIYAVCHSSRKVGGWHRRKFG